MERPYDNGIVADMRSNPFFENALSGKEVVSDPMLDNDGSDIIMIYAVPVIDSEIAGVLMAIRDGLELSICRESEIWGDWRLLL